jgi:hypothetical protein
MVWTEVFLRDAPYKAETPEHGAAPYVEGFWQDDLLLVTFLACARLSFTNDGRIKVA